MAGNKELYQSIVQELLIEYAQIPYLQENLTDETIFDQESGRFLLVTVGWQERTRVNTIVLDLGIVDDRVWIQCNNTDQDIAEELIQRGIPRASIVVPKAVGANHLSQPHPLREFAMA